MSSSPASAPGLVVRRHARPRQASPKALPYTAVSGPSEPRAALLGPGELQWRTCRRRSQGGPWHGPEETWRRLGEVVRRPGQPSRGSGGGQRKHGRSPAEVRAASARMRPVTEEIGRMDNKEEDKGTKKNLMDGGPYMSIAHPHLMSWNQTKKLMLSHIYMLLSIFF